MPKTEREASKGFPPVHIMEVYILKLVMIIGPHAVGKMTVGQELCKQTGLKLFHNHMTIDILSDLFSDMPEEFRRLRDMFRQEIFSAYSRSDEYGMVFTLMWAFDCREDWDYVREVETLFKEQGAQVYYVELEADSGVRMQRNHTENRLLNKPSKRDIAKSDWLFTNIEAAHRLNSLPGELEGICENYMRIDNTDIPPEEAARMIKERFGL